MNSGLTNGTNKNHSQNAVKTTNYGNFGSRWINKQKVINKPE